MSNVEDFTFGVTLSHIRHELRTPAGHIIGYAEMMAADMARHDADEVVRDLQAIASSGERLVAMIEEHLGAANRSIEDLDLADAQFELRMQLNHVSGYTEMLTETAEEEGWDDLLEDLERIAAAVGRMLQVLEARLTPESFDADVTRQTTGAADTGTTGDKTLELRGLAQGGTLLVIDDDATNQDLLERRLARYGFDVTTADSGQLGYEMATVAAPDLIIMELLMEGWSGLDTLRRLKATPETKDLPVIILSAIDDLDQMVECVLAGADDYLISPIRPVLLLARIGASLEKVRLRQRFTRQLRIFISSPGDVIPERRES